MKKNTKEDRIYFRVSDKEKKALETEAKKKGLTISAYIRMLIYEAIPKISN